MLKLLRNKIQSLTETQVNILTAILVLINLGIVIFWINFWVSLPKTTSPPIEEKPASLVGEIPEELKPGEIGEPEEGEGPLVELPSVISNTSGTIKEIQKDRLIILGDGSNFSDQKERELTLIFTNSTITFEPGQKIRYQALESLKYLKIGDLITISSPENIRGKTEFIVNYINKL
ncbi:hypothetical protein KJA14_00205 [Patescibacteria group bacterium]|nr:hypothetical protein [Patescibacteria group bacterium]